MSHVRVEIKKAGDGVNYPQKGKTVTIHYSGQKHFNMREDNTETECRKLNLE